MSANQTDIPTVPSFTIVNDALYDILAAADEVEPIEHTILDPSGTKYEDQDPQEP